jgi:hypothetical protein
MRQYASYLAVGFLTLSLSSCGDSNSDRPLEIIHGQFITSEGRLRLNSESKHEALAISSGRAEMEVYTDRVVFRNALGSYAFQFPMGMESQLQGLIKLKNLSQRPEKLVDGGEAKQPVSVFGSKMLWDSRTNETTKVEQKVVGGGSSNPSLMQVSDTPLPMIGSSERYERREIIETQRVSYFTFRLSFLDIESEEILGAFVGQVSVTNSEVSKILSDWR